MTDELKSADIQLIQRILPHRYPFLLVDRVERIDGYASALGVKNVTMNEPHFQGHFPGTPIMPGVTIIEAMAQTAGVMLGMGFDVIDTELLIYFMSIDKCKFRRKVVPGDVLEMEVTTLRGKPRGKLFKFQGIARVGDEVAAEAEFSAYVDWTPGESA
ncbi:MAG TPA: 3-hydroxyacyl-[acyl-carrier-protein] dehydratase FabZ [Rhodobacteraceae bacterium]|nr:3-hydroxyacyl-[acyl-carrier-protein] dehydratase FabZ [Paracoccaceae bacterium]